MRHHLVEPVGSSLIEAVEEVPVGVESDGN